MKLARYVGRFLVMGAIVSWFVVVYLAGRLVRWRRPAIAHWKGQVLRRAMAALGATFVKLGQVLSTRPDLLAPEIIDELRQLQDRMPPFAFARMRRIVEEDLGGKLEERFAELDPTPVAAASVAQVHRGRLSSGEEVAVKVLRPDVREKVERDAAILLWFAKLIALHPTWRLSDPVGHLESFEQGILDQTDLRLELAHYEKFREHFARTPGVKFPSLHPSLSGPRVLTMEFIHGSKVDALPPGDHRELASRLQHVVLKMCFEDGFFHADLHPGNVRVTDDGAIAIFDAGLVKHIGEAVLLQFMDFTKCISMGTPADFVNHLKTFHKYLDGVDWEGVERDISVFIDHFRKQNIGELEIGGLMNEVFALGRKYRVHPLPELAVVFVGLVTAEGIGKQLHPGNNLFHDTAAYLMPLLAGKGLALVASPPRVA